MTRTVELSTSDWTVSDEGRSNSSAKFEEIVAEVERLIRGDAYKLIAGRADATARLIVAQLAHVHHLSPPTKEGKRDVRPPATTTS